MAPKTPKQSFAATIVPDGEMSLIDVPFDPRQLFGKVRAPVRVTIKRHTYRSTICFMRGRTFVPLRKSNREAAGVAGGETVTVTLELDSEARVVEPPPELVRALKAAPPAWARWGELSYTLQREQVEAVQGAKKPETRARRIAAAVALCVARPAKRTK